VFYFVLHYFYNTLHIKSRSQWGDRVWIVQNIRRGCENFDKNGCTAQF